jgi:myo-inositol-1(or 4)-monophosphatase
LAEPERLAGGLSPRALALAEIARSAGQVALKFFRGENRSWTKSGNSPVSDADIATHRHLCDAIAARFPGAVFVSEEDEEMAEIPEKGMAIIGDPIDGTRGFLAGNPNWAVALALLEEFHPVAGVVCCPALDRTIVAEVGRGAFLNGERLANAPTGQLRRLTGSQRINALLAERFGDSYEIVEFIPSLACRLVMVATGEIDAALARPGAHVWDIAATAVILKEAGGALVTPDGRPWKIFGRSKRAPALVAAGAGRLEAALALAKSSRILQ